MNGEGITDIVATLLEKRGIRGSAVQTFLNPDFARDTHDPFLLADMDRAVARIFAAMGNEERIAIYADFDCDGIPGAALLFDTFRKIGYTNVEVYIPHRDREGYGYHKGAIDTLAERGVSLIITIDVGTVAFEGVAHANVLGIDTIVTDHHEIQSALPDCIVINPKRGEYPFKDLCGAATAWKLASALLIEGRRRAHPSFAAIPEGWEKWLLDLAAIATVADLVPLTGENRALVHFGLTVLRKSPRPGIRALVHQARMRQSELTEDDIGFTIAPRVNAASRMDEPELAFRLLSTDDSDEATTIAAKLESLNRKRRSIVAGIVREAKARVHARFTPHDRVIVLGDIEWKPALMGLAANSLMEGRGGIVCMWGRDANGNLKGSCRSDGTSSIVDLFRTAKDSLIEFGGHHASGGFSVSHEAVHTLHESFTEAERTVPRVERVEKTPELEIPLSQVSITLLRDLARLAPFGMGNPKPLLRVRRIRITDVRRFGKDMNHTEVQLICQDTGVRRRAFQFFRAPSDFTLEPRPDTDADLIATLEKDAFKGRDALALRIADILHSRA